jgi:hypothetical protein
MIARFLVCEALAILLRACQIRPDIDLQVSHSDHESGYIRWSGPGGSTWTIWVEDGVPTMKVQGLSGKIRVRRDTTFHWAPEHQCPASISQMLALAIFTMQQDENGTEPWVSVLWLAAHQVGQTVPFRDRQQVLAVIEMLEA